MFFRLTADGCQPLPRECDKTLVISRSWPAQSRRRQGSCVPSARGRGFSGGLDLIRVSVSHEVA